MEFTNEQRLKADAAFANRLNVVHHAYVDICGDLAAGALLGQVLYWFGADRNGRSRARIYKHGFWWIAKARTDWWDEIRISAKKYDRAVKILKERGFIEVRTMKLNGNLTTHLRMIPEAIKTRLLKFKKGAKKAEAEGEEKEESRYYLCKAFLFTADQVEAIA